MKILFITHLFYPKIGGIEVNSEILANGFSAGGHEVRLLTWAEDPSGRTFRYPVIRKPNVLQLVKAHQWADVVFENNPCLRLSWPALFLDKPSVVAVRTWINRNDGRFAWQDKLKIKWLSRAKAVIAVSKAIRDTCWPEATVIGNPYRIELFGVLPGHKPFRDFVFLGRLVSDKGADLAIKSFSDLIKNKLYAGSRDAAVLTIIGDGPELLPLKKLASDLGVSGQVHFLGALTGRDLVRELSDHKYLLVPSLWKEPFGNVALEGMACGCLPFVSDGGGLPDAVGDAGIVFERGNSKSLSDAVLNLLQHPELEEGLRNRAATHLKSHRPETVSKKYLDVLINATKKKEL